MGALPDTQVGPKWANLNTGTLPPSPPTATPPRSLPPSLPCPPLCACRASCRSQEVRGARACVVQGCWASGQGDLHGGGAPDLLVLGGWFRTEERWVWAGFIWLRPVFPAHGCICTRPANATRTLMLCYTKVESCVAFVECEFAWCEFGVVLSCVFEVCVSTAIASPIISHLPPRRLAPSPGYCGWLLCE